MKRAARLTAAACVALATIWIGSWLRAVTSGWQGNAVGLTMAAVLFASVMVFMANVLLEDRP